MVPLQRDEGVGVPINHFTELRLGPGGDPVQVVPRPARPVRVAAGRVDREGGHHQPPAAIRPHVVVIGKRPVAAVDATATAPAGRLVRVGRQQVHLQPPGPGRLDQH